MMNMNFIKILEPGGCASLQDIKLPVVVQGRKDPFGYFVDKNQFENLPGFRADLLDRDLNFGETEFLFWTDECEIFKD